MILIPGVLAYVFTPRTGSRTTEQAFLRYIPAAQDIGRHHGYVECDEPVYATIREPCSQVLSHYWRVKDELGFEQYVKQRTPRLNIHHEIVDRYFIYENGLVSIFEQLGFSGVRLEHIGATHADKVFLTPARIDLINRTFAEDVALYQQVNHVRNHQRI